VSVCNGPFVWHPGPFVCHPGLFICHPGLFICHPGLFICRPGLFKCRPGLFICHPGLRAGIHAFKCASQGLKRGPRIQCRVTPQARCASHKRNGPRIFVRGDSSALSSRALCMSSRALCMSSRALCMSSRALCMSSRARPGIHVFKRATRVIRGMDPGSSSRVTVVHCHRERSAAIQS